MSRKILAATPRGGETQSRANGHLTSRGIRPAAPARAGPGGSPHNDRRPRSCCSRSGRTATRIAHPSLFQKLSRRCQRPRRPAATCPG